MEITLDLSLTGSIYFNRPVAAPAETTDPHWANVVFLAGFEGASVSIADESPSAHVPDTSGPSPNPTDEEGAARFGARGLAFSDNNYLTTPASADWQFASGAFTVEGWFKWDTGTSSVNRVLMRSGENAGGQIMWRLAHITGNLRLSVSANGSTLTTTASGLWAPTEEQWHHLVAEFDGAAYRVYADGVMVGKSTTPLVMFDGTDDMRIGGMFAATNGFLGYVDEVRVTKGVARYASDAGYTVPASAFPRSA